MEQAALRQLAALHGVQLSYMDSSGQERQAGDAALLAILRALGVDLQGPGAAQDALAQITAARGLIPPVLVAWNGECADIPLAQSLPDGTHASYELRLEDGTRRAGNVRARAAGGQATVRVDERLPFGYHELTVQIGTRADRALLMAAPTRAEQAAGPRAWGTFLPLYSARSSRQQGIGDFTTLHELTRWTGAMGGSYFCTLPLLATFLDRPFEPSPYSPITRLFWNEIFIDVQAARFLVPGGARDETELHQNEKQSLEQLNQTDTVDYARVYQVKRKILTRMARCFFESGGEGTPEYMAFLQQHALVEDYAAFRAAGDHQQRSWQVWPEPMRSGQLDSASYQADDLHFHLFAQFAACQQLKTVAAQDDARLYLDLPLGVHPDGYDVWRHRDLFARGVSTGAPPDAFFTHGQNWGFAPISPTAMRAQGYGYFRAALAAHLRYARVLRLDHVMALHRLFWIPDGMSAADGVYVRYPASELLALLCLESHRHGALIVGEDLGTVPPEVRVAMERHGIARMYVVQFEARADTPTPLPEPPAQSVACLNTHDMPTFEAFRRGLDADLRGELGLLGPDEVVAARHERRTLVQALIQQLRRAGFLHEPAQPEQVRDALLAFLAASPAQLMLVNLEDLWQEERPQNVPGTSTERPNWRRRTRPSLEELMNWPETTAILNRLNEIRREL